MNKALNYNLKDISLAVDFIIKNTTSKTGGINYKIVYISLSVIVEDVRLS